ncbi:hypothetical protein HDU89_004353 [Geranomyces variabilis]|nr:hypothetical protein HDU89_004353 [Geranomyces variabilis]
MVQRGKPEVALNEDGSAVWVKIDVRDWLCKTVTKDYEEHAEYEAYLREPRDDDSDEWDDYDDEPAEGYDPECHGGDWYVAQSTQTITHSPWKSLPLQSFHHPLVVGPASDMPIDVEATASVTPIDVEVTIYVTPTEMDNSPVLPTDAAADAYVVPLVEIDDGPEE